MRRILRPPLHAKAEKYLSRKQREIDTGREARPTWNSARKSKSLREIVEVLAALTGTRRRCMFCEDSRGTDVDHFWPISPHKSRTFLWANMLWICSGCNLSKSNHFELDGQGRPLLIDPMAEDPGEYLFFDSATGIITAKFDAQTGQPDPKGAYTTNAKVLPLNIECTTDGRQRTVRNLRRAVRHFLHCASNAASPASDQNELWDAIMDNDHYGLALWFFVYDGSQELPFSELRSSYGNVWRFIANLLQH